MHLPVTRAVQDVHCANWRFKRAVHHSSSIVAAPLRDAGFLIDIRGSNKIAHQEKKSDADHCLRTGRSAIKVSFPHAIFRKGMLDYPCLPPMIAVMQLMLECNFQMPTVQPDFGIQKNLIPCTCR
jgi:hypothetical protein